MLIRPLFTESSINYSCYSDMCASTVKSKTVLDPAAVATFSLYCCGKSISACWFPYISQLDDQLSTSQLDLAQRKFRAQWGLWHDMGSFWCVWSTRNVYLPLIQFRPRAICNHIMGWSDTNDVCSLRSSNLVWILQQWWIKLCQLLIWIVHSCSDPVTVLSTDLVHNTID